MDPDEIKRLIEAGIPGCQAEVDGDGTHFTARVISDQFAGKNLLQQHRIVYQVLGDRMGTTIHALSIQTYTPEKWDGQRDLGVV